MENILVTSGVGTTSETAVDLAIADIAIGEFIVIAEGKGIIGAGQVVPAGTREVQFLHKLGTTDVRNTVSIPLDNIVSINHQAPVTGVVKILKIADEAGPSTALVIPATGEGNITLRNLSYNHAISTQRINGTFIKKSTETVSDYLDRVVAELNAAMALQDTPFAVVAKVGISPNFALTFTSSNTNVDLAVSVDGIFADFPAYVEQEAVAPIGAGIDVYNMEVDMSRHLGNGGYVENTDLWFKLKPQADVNAQYQISTITWRGIVSTPQSTKQVAIDTLAVAYPVSAAADVIAVINSFVTTREAVVIDVDDEATDGDNEEEPAAAV